MSCREFVNMMGIASLFLSLLFWFALLPKTIPGVHAVHWGISTHVKLWGGAFFLSLPALRRGSRWWIVATLLPLFNVIFVILVVNVGEWLASRPN